MHAVVGAPTDLREELPHRLGIAIGQTRRPPGGQTAPLVEPVGEFSTVALPVAASPARLGRCFQFGDIAKALTKLRRELPPPRDECGKPLQLLTPMAACRSVSR